MKPEEKSRLIIDKKLIESGWVIQDVKTLNLSASLGVAVREFPTSTGPVDYALFIEGVPVGVIEAKKTDEGENITAVEGQSSRYANSTFKWIKSIYLSHMKRRTSLHALLTIMILSIVRERYSPSIAPKL